jgi:hypothetical protein
VRSLVSFWQPISPRNTESKVGEITFFIYVTC